MQLEDHYSELALNLPLCNLTKIAVVRNVWQHLCVQGHVHIGHCVLLHVCVQSHVCTAAFVCAGSCPFCCIHKVMFVCIVQHTYKGFHPCCYRRSTWGSPASSSSLLLGSTEREIKGLKIKSVSSD
jgi:hypothetical protein